MFALLKLNPAFPNVPSFSFNNANIATINTPRTFRAVTPPQLLDNITYIHGSHVFRAGLNFRFYQHNDQRGQPGGINVTPSISFSSGTRAPSGFSTPALASSTAGGINATDNTRLLNTI